MDPFISAFLSSPLAIDPAGLEAIAASSVRGQLAEARMRLAGDPFTLLEGGVAHISVQGPLGWNLGWMGQVFGMADWGMVADATLAAAESDAVSTILLDIDSPGGSIAGISDAVEAIHLARDAGTRVVAIGHDFLFSAAYWWASQADALILTPTGMAGCLGVIIPYEDSSKHFEKEGFKRRLISSSPIKGLNMAGIEVTEPMVESERDSVMQLHELFAADVTAGRGVSRATFESWVASPKLVGERAVEAGMVDRVMSFEHLLDELTGDDGSLVTSRAQQPGATAMTTAETLNRRAAGKPGASSAKGEETTPDDLREKFPDAVAEIEEDARKKQDEESEEAKAKAKAEMDEEEKKKEEEESDSAPAASAGGGGDYGAILAAIGETTDAAKAFAGDMVQEGATPAMAKSLWARVKSTNARAEAVAAAASAEPANRNTSGSGDGGRGGGLDYMGMVEKVEQEKGILRHEAVALVNNKHPELRAAYVGREMAGAR